MCLIGTPVIPKCEIKPIIIIINPILKSKAKAKPLAAGKWLLLPALVNQHWGTCEPLRLAFATPFLEGLFPS